MKIHSDTLARSDLLAHVPAGCDLLIAERGSRKRARAFDVSMAARPGADQHGIKRCYAANTGQYGAERGYMKAATYIEWGDWMVDLLRIDPAAIIGPYDGAASFIEQTTSWAPNRPEREDAVAHAARWARELAAPKVRLDYLRRQLDAECISYGELAELQGLAEHIEPWDVQLLEAAGVPEHPESIPPVSGVDLGAVERLEAFAREARESGC